MLVVENVSRGIRLVSGLLLLQAILAGNAHAGEPAGVAVRAKAVRQVIAHRGSSADRPECTLSSLRRAIEVGATASEVDVR